MNTKDCLHLWAEQPGFGAADFPAETADDPAIWNSPGCRSDLLLHFALVQPPVRKSN